MKKSQNNIEKIYPLTSMQEGMLFHSIKEKSNVYFNQLFYTTTGKINLNIFSDSLDILSERHDIFRTAFVYETTKDPIQVVLKNRTIIKTILDKVDLGTDEYLNFINEYREKDIEKGFDLLKDPLIRITIVKRDENLYDFLWSYHHIILDGWCHSVLFHELQEIYFSLKENRNVTLLPSVPFGNYVKWLEKKDLNESLNYWKEYLKGYEHVAEIPRIINKDYLEINKTEEKLKFNKETYRVLNEIAKENKITLNDIFQSIWGLLIARFSGSNEIVYGNVVSGRPAELEGVERCLGMFINTIPVRLQFKEEDTLLDLTHKIHDDFLNGLPHHYNSLVDIANTTKLKGGLIKHIIAFENYPLSQTSKEENKDNLFEVSEVGFFDYNNYDFDLDVELAEEIKVSFAYNARYYHPEYVKKIANSFEFLVTQFIQNPHQKINEVNLVDLKQKKQLLHDFNKGEIDLNIHDSINVLFEKEVSQKANKIAVVHNNKKWTYQQLNELANQIANTLLNKGVEKGDFIGLHLERSPELIAALMGVFKAGGVYVPLDTQNPKIRTIELIKDAEIKGLIGKKDTLLALKGTDLFNSKIKQIICLDGKINKEDFLVKEAKILISSEREIIESNSNNPENRNELTDWAYMLYTSGSTGKPKGAITRYDGALNHIFSEFKALDLKDGFCFLQSASIASDISVWQIVAPLLRGGNVLIAEKKDVLDYKKTLHLMKEYKVTIAEFVPSYLVGFIDYVSELNAQGNILPSLKWMMMSGEEAPVNLVNKWLELFPGCKVLNSYGPCEASDDITQYEISSQISSNITKVPIGKPIDNMNIFVLNDSEKLVPLGVSGEICVSGVGVGAGYFKNPEKTNKSFRPNPFSSTLGDVMYKTGDLGRWLPDGNLEFLGRKDRQVKIRGNRVELGEIGVFIKNNDSVENAAVIAYKGVSSDISLIAFIVKGDQSTENDEVLKKKLSSKCSEGLPQYMQPSEYIIIDNIPQNLSDKVDERKLTELYDELSNRDSTAKETLAVCNTETERLVKAIWEQILQKTNIGVYDDFFTIGGHSLSAIKAKAAILKNLKVNLEIPDLFTHTKLNKLAAYIDQKSIQEEVTSIEIQEKPKKIPLSYAQESLWFIDSLQGNTTEYNISATLKLTGNLNVDLLEASLKSIINRHETLRSIVLSDSGIPYLSFLETENWTLNAINETYNCLDTKIEQLISKPFNLATDFKLKASIIQKNSTENILVLVMHHIASDGWSDSILVDELLAFYNAGLNKTKAILPKLPVQYSDYILWQHKNKAKLNHQIAYWKDNLKEVTTLEFPTDYLRSKNESNEGDSVTFSIDKELSEKLKKLSVSNGSTLYMTLLSAFKILLYKYSGQKDICVGTPVAGRVNQDLENLIGFFVNMLVLRSNVDPNINFKDFLSEVKNTSLNAFKNQDVPFEKVVEITTKQRDLSRNPLHQVLFTLQNTPELKKIVLGDLNVELLKTNHLQVLSDLHFLIEEAPSQNKIILEIEYRKSLFKATTIERLGAHYIQLLKSIVENPSQKISDLTILNSEETNILLNDFNNTTTNYFKDETLVDLFHKSVSKTPNLIAVTHKEESFTYKDLDEASNKLAQYLLKKKDIKIEDIVAVKIERSEWLIIALLGILKSGGVYLPIDPNYPQERINYLESDSNCKIIIDDEFIKEYIDISNSYLPEPTNIDLSINNLAYVIYTSGSTGKPKGVMIEHKGIANTILAQIPTFRISEGTRCLQFANQCFDASIWEILLSILGGGNLYIIEDDKKTDINYFINFLKSNLIDCAVIPPAYLKILNVKDLTNLQTLVTGGEEAPLEQIKLFKAQGGHYVNAYGPTESSICATTFEGNISNSVSIGKPISNTEAYILNESQSLLPIGVVGELCVSGAGLARGYLNNEELTREKFIAHPFKKGLRLYKTGDLAKWLPDGNIEFIGRLDNQVKIRGYRIELGEIENTILRNEDIFDCCVISKKDTIGINYLIGYIVKKNDIENQVLEHSLKSELPEYMVPKLWMVLIEMPLNSSGKIDKKSLPEPDLNTISTKEYVAARNEIEESLVLIWEQLLNVSRIGIYDDFFELGGHSLLVTQLVSLIREKLVIELAIKDVFEFKTIEELSSYIRYKELDTVEIGETEFNVTIEI
ncbi:non-ribosomal peptide synthetase [Tenacibaculum ovolyticum]|uniref:non-ribosomal peptide synthetase n=1 Tax=Tenacibaculum ovolyticum TaxID=104270 RepID=UPI001F3B3FC9|nr:non-ribosomal peptide synthetase [Tenacibaculum ovolyticum]